MPTYEYACTECGDRQEVVQSFSDERLTVCPVCGGRLRKVFSPVGIVFKGSGFYRTDSRSKEGAAAAAGTGAPDGSAAAKPETGSKDAAAASSDGTSGKDSSGKGKTGSGTGSSGSSGSGGAGKSSSAAAGSKVA